MDKNRLPIFYKSLAYTECLGISVRYKVHLPFKWNKMFSSLQHSICAIAMKSENLETFDKIYVYFRKQ